VHTGLVGSTGFVGTTLRGQMAIDAAYHRPDIGGIHGEVFDLLICAGAPAEKWRANAEPEADRLNLEQLVEDLRRARADRFVLISTVDVYPDPVDVDESTPLDREANSAYGRHRLWLEDRCRETFDRVTIIRLPGLFGAGLKKNLLFDLLNDRNLGSRFQFYDTARLAEDLSRAVAADLDIVNFATAPVVAREAAAACFGVDLPVPDDRDPVLYDMQTRHAALFGGADGYLMDAEAELEAIQRWVRVERSARAPARAGDPGVADHGVTA
jgi:NAD dependent epimerase/dehydratase family